MPIQLAQRLQGVAESATLKMAAATRELASRGVKVVPFTVGEPNFLPPAIACEASIKAIREGFHRYTPVPGIADLRSRIARRWKEENGLTYAPEQVVVTVGAKQAIFNLLLALISRGDEVVIPAPYWTSYPEMVRIAEGTPVIVTTTEAEGFKMSPESLRRALTPRTRLLILNSPSNPTGALYSRDELKALAKCLEGTDIVVCSDEIYEKLIFDGEFTAFGSVSADAFNRTVTVNGFSKSHAMTGWRLGYAAGPKAIIDAMVLIQGQSTSGANGIAQKGALAGMEWPPAEMAAVVATLRERRDRLMRILGESRRLSFSKPPAAFYLFLNIERAYGGAVKNSDQMAFHLLNEAHVGTVAGSGFGMEHYLRLSFAVSAEELEIGAKAIVKAVAALE